MCQVSGVRRDVIPDMFQDEDFSIQPHDIFIDETQGNCKAPKGLKKLIMIQFLNKIASH
jgi:hypothetical protein